MQRSQPAWDTEFSIGDGVRVHPILFRLKDKRYPAWESRSLFHPVFYVSAVIQDIPPVI